MTLSKSLITGHLNDATQIRFTLSAWDSELAEIVLSQSQTFDLVDGDLPDTCEIWQNQAGLRGTSYTVTAINRGGDGFPAREELGIIQVGTASSYVLADLLEASGSITPGNTYTVLTEAERAQLVTLTGLQNLANKTLSLAGHTGTIAQLITAAAAGDFDTLPDNSVVWAGGCPFAKRAGAAYTGLPVGFVPSGVPTPMHFGAVGDGVTDDYAALAAGLAWCAVQSPAFVLDLVGERYAVSAPLYLSTSRLGLRNGQLTPYATFTPSADGNFLVVVASQYNVVEDITFKCDVRVDAVGQIGSGSGYGARYSGLVIEDFHTYGIKNEGDGDQRIINCSITQSGPLYALRTGYGLHIGAGDTKIFGTISRFCGRNLYINANTTMVGDCHFYNGNSTVTDTPGYNSVNVEIASGSGQQFCNIYLDKGRIVLRDVFSSSWVKVYYLFDATPVHDSIWVFSTSVSRANFPTGLVLAGQSGTGPLTSGAMDFIELHEDSPGLWGANAVATVTAANAQRDTVDFGGKDQGSIATRDQATMITKSDARFSFYPPGVTDLKLAPTDRYRVSEKMLTATNIKSRVVTADVASMARVEVQGARNGTGNIAAELMLSNRGGSTGLWELDADLTYYLLRMMGGTTGSGNDLKFVFSDKAAATEYDLAVVSQTLWDFKVPIRTTPTTVAALPSPATAGAGARGFVTNATAPTFGAIVVGGGTVKTPVYSDGINWRVG